MVQSYVWSDVCDVSRVKYSGVLRVAELAILFELPVRMKERFINVKNTHMYLLDQVCVSYYVVPVVHCLLRLQRRKYVYTPACASFEMRTPIHSIPIRPNQPRTLTGHSIQAHVTPSRSGSG